GDPNACVAHGDGDLVMPTAIHSELYATAARCVLDGIRHQVEKELPQPRPIAHHDATLDRGQLHRQSGVLTKNDRCLENLTQKWLELYRSAVNVESSFVGPREREQAVDEVGHARRFLKCF